MGLRLPEGSERLPEEEPFDRHDGLARYQLDQRVFDLCADAFETVGICLAVNSFGICKTNLENVPKSYPNAWTWPNPAPALPQQFFFSRA